MQRQQLIRSWQSLIPRIKFNEVITALARIESDPKKADPTHLMLKLAKKNIMLATKSSERRYCKLLIATQEQSELNIF